MKKGARHKCGFEGLPSKSRGQHLINNDIFRDPRRLCRFLLESCLERGVQLHHPARALSIDKDMRDELSSIRILNTKTSGIVDIPCTKILIAAGAWSNQVFATLFPDSTKKLPISSLAGHSLVVRSPR